jgi:hypothetical protein
MESTSEKPTVGADRQTSVDSAQFFEGDDCDDYDDFGIDIAAGGGGKSEKRREERGGGPSSIYSAKHTRQKEAQRQRNTPKTKAPTSTQIVKK